MARAWYSYDGTGAIDQPANYFFTSVKPLCRTGANLCSVYAAYGGLRPLEISENLQTYIANGLATQLPQPQAPVGSKKYVYMKVPS